MSHAILHPPIGLCPFAPSPRGRGTTLRAERGGPRPPRHGLSLTEMMVSMVILTAVAGVLATLGNAVHQGWDYSQRQTNVAQHARVAIDRIDRAVENAYTSVDHPGIMVVYDVVGSDKFPETLIVWRPATTPTNPTGPPLISECVFFCPDPNSPNRLLEITAPSDTRVIPLTDELNTSSWRTTLQAIKTASGSQRVLLTDRLRVASLSGTTPITALSVVQASASEGGVKLQGTMTNIRACLQFVRTLRPTTSAYQNYKSGATAWSDLNWPQGLYGSQTGQRHVWLRYDFQCVGDVASLNSNASVEECVPFFGSSALFDMLPR